MADIKTFKEAEKYLQSIGAQVRAVTMYEVTLKDGYSEDALDEDAVIDIANEQKDEAEEAAEERGEAAT